MHPFFIAVQFLTRLPVPLKGEYAQRQVAQSVLYYPLVGLIIGGMLWLVALLVNSFAPALTAITVLVLWVVITGGLHLDGLADSADAWAGGYGDRQKSLDIMKDPAAGPLAVVVLVLLLLAKFSALSYLLEHNHLWSLLIAPILGRLSIIVLFVTTPYVRQQGLGAEMAEHLNSVQAYAVIAVICGLFIIAFPGLIVITVLACVCVVLFLLRYMMLKRLGGMTGDTMGASLEIVEAVSLFVIAFLAIN